MSVKTRMKGFLQRIINSDSRLKEDWEFKWQRDEWSLLYRQPEVKAKVLEYWIRYRYLDEIRKRVPIDNKTFVLDVGCGISSVLHYLPGHRYGIDPIADRYKTIYDYPQDIEIQAAYGESIPFPEHFFDVVTCSNCIDHTNDPVRVVAEIWRVLKPGGHLVLTCEVFEKDLGKRNDGHPNTMTVDNLYGLINVRTKFLAHFFMPQEFKVIEHWDSPWIGLLGYVNGRPASDQREHIFLLTRS